MAALSKISGSGPKISGGGPKISGGGKLREDRIFVGQVKQLLSGSKTSVISGAVGVLIMVVVNHDLVSAQVLFAWTAFVVAGITSRIGVNLWVGRLQPTDHDFRKWRHICNLYMASILWAGLAWGMAGLLFMPSDAPERFAITAMILMGVSSGGMTTFSPVLRIYIAYIIVVLAPAGIGLVSGGSDTDFAFGAMALSYIFFLSVYGHRQNQTFKVSFALRFENQDLVDSLTAEKESAEALNRSLAGEVKERRKIARELGDQTRLLQRAEEEAQIGHWRWNESDGAIYWSDEVYRILGINPEGFTPNFDDVLELLHPDDRQGYRDAWRRTVRDRVGHEAEARLIRRDGSVRNLWAELKFEDADTKDSGEMFGILKDVTDFKRSEAALITARDEAERANHAKSEFLSSMSHELRTPMNAVLGFAQLLKADTDHQLSGSQETFVDEILKSGHHMMELVNDILDLAAIETGHVDFKPSKINPVNILRDCLKMVAASADTQGIIVSNFCNGDNFPAVYADDRRLRQIFLNLLSNAIKYNHPGGTVEVRCQSLPDGFLRFLVSDTGKGISDAHRDRIFEPFDRLGAENTNVGGTGVGLTVTRQLVKLMGGRIGFESVLEEGTTFWIDLPLVGGPVRVASAPAS